MPAYAAPYTACAARRFLRLGSTTSCTIAEERILAKSKTFIAKASTS